MKQTIALMLLCAIGSNVTESTFTQACLAIAAIGWAAVLIFEAAEWWQDGEGERP